jgi:hypothetical protein
MDLLWLAPALLSNMMMSRKVLKGTNTLAYFSVEIARMKKSLKTLKF